MSIPGYRLHDPTLPPATLTADDLGRMKQAVLLGDGDIAALRRSHALLASRTDEILDECFRSTHDTTALYYYGIAAIGNGQPEKAAPALQTVLASTSVYRENAAWYLALSRVQACQKAEALPLLDEIARGDGAHRMQAAQLAKELR